MFASSKVIAENVPTGQSAGTEVPATQNFPAGHGPYVAPKGGQSLGAPEAQ